MRGLFDYRLKLTTMVNFDDDNDDGDEDDTYHYDDDKKCWQHFLQNPIYLND